MIEELIEHLLIENDEFTEEMENLIARNAKASLSYAKQIGKRFEKGEKAILTDPKLACEYACDVIEGRWEEAEDIISKNGRASYEYYECSTTPHKVSDKIHKSIEQILLKQTSSRRIEKYASMIQGRLPQSLHNRLILEGNNWYVNFIEKEEEDCVRYLRTLDVEERNKLLNRL
jgi:hypothetical protein